MSKRNSKYHPERPCSNCFLCGKSNTYCSHFQSWSQHAQSFVKKFLGSISPNPDGCTCFSHYVEAKRNHPPSYVPKWKKSASLPEPPSQHGAVHCSYQSCRENYKLIRPSFTNTSVLLSTLGITQQLGPILLCSTHYNQIYRNWRINTCASCGIRPKHGTAFTRHSPNARMINEVLRLQDSDELIGDNDYICSRCYKQHLGVIDSFTSNTYFSDDYLQYLITLWKSQIYKCNDILTQSVLHTVVHVASELANERAILLPQVSDFFMKSYLSSTEESNEHPTLQSNEGTLKFSTKWLLKQLLLYLHTHMDYKCVHNKFGIILFRKGGNLLISLSWALGRGQNDKEITYKLSDRAKEQNVPQVLQEAADVINDMIHKDMKTLISMETVPDPKCLDIDAHINKINPNLWLFLELATRTARQRNGLREDNCHIKKLRRFFIYCLLVYCTNTQRHTVFHSVLTDTVELCGGSRKLITILNQYGIVTSTDTHDRFVTEVAKFQRNRSIWDDLPPQILTLSSADNFDMLVSRRPVYCGDQTRSFHGTTLQLVQPDPSLLCITEKRADDSTNLRGVNNGKRTCAQSPASSPHKLGKVGPKRPRTIKPRSLAEQLMPNQDQDNQAVMRIQNLVLEGFTELSTRERQEKKDLECKVFTYMYVKEYLGRIESPNELKELKEVYAQPLQDPPKSNIYYFEIIDENPDSTETMRYVSELLIQNKSIYNDYVILTGDGKTYEHLMEVKRLYGTSLDKLLIFPGDWHTLKNFQPVLMKIYYHTGLKQIAQASGFRGETLTSLENCSDFKRTHDFLLQAWQAIYISMYKSFIENKQGLPTVNIVKPDLSDVEVALQNANLQQNFVSFISHMSTIDDTWKFWSQFILEDCFCYLELFLGIRCQKWDLRMCALKSMAPLFTAYDRTTYRRLIPNHLADIQQFPHYILEKLKRGFTVSITGQRGHAVAIDEAHEMCVNSDLKMAITTPTQSFLQKTSLILRYRIATHQNLLRQTSSSPCNREKCTDDAFDSTPKTKAKNENVTAMISEISSNGLFPSNQTTNRGLQNVFTKLEATPEQRHDLLNFRQIGTEDLTFYIQYHFLKEKSTTPPRHKHKLLTMAPTKKMGIRKMKQREKELRQVTKCLRQRLAWCNRTGERYNPEIEQYSVYPRAIADERGNPHTGSKSVWKDKLRKRYTNHIITDALPQGWNPDIVIVDAMFIINCKPLRSNTSMADYAMFLFNRFLLPHYDGHVSEIHLLFDNPNLKLDFNPKCYEQTRRDKPQNAHEHIDFLPTTKPPAAWRSYIECRKCKRSIVEAIGLSYIQSVRFRLQAHQKLILSGCFAGTDQAALCIRGNADLPMACPEYAINSQEADMRIWRHFVQSGGGRYLIYSPDSDIYNIGLPFVSAATTYKEVIVQLDLPQSQSRLYLNINKLLQAFQHDPDLASLQQVLLPNILQMLYICSGCDYISYFSGHQGKSVFFNQFFLHANFVNGQQMEGSLSDIYDTDTGYLAFLRLIGTLYFKKHYSAMVSLKEVETPSQLLNAQQCHSIKEAHLNWYNEIRKIVSDRIINEEERMPSPTSMWRHWLRSCWVARMWRNSDSIDILRELPAPEESGWTRNEDEKYVYDWECPTVLKSIKDTINFLTKGCSCKQGCSTKRCKCRKNDHHCGPGCTCINCVNVLDDSSSNDLDEPESNDDNTDAESEEEEEETITTEIVTLPDLLEDQL